MTTRYYVDSDGAYLGGWDGDTGTQPPDGAIQVPFAPNHASQVWDGEKYGATPELPEESDRARIRELSDSAHASLTAAEQEELVRLVGRAFF
jgi:hypothetical protein